MKFMSIYKLLFESKLGADEDVENSQLVCNKNVPSQFVKLVKTIKPRR